MTKILSSQVNVNHNGQYFSSLSLYYIFGFETALIVIDKLQDSKLFSLPELNVNSCLNRGCPGRRRNGC